MSDRDWSVFPKQWRDRLDAIVPTAYRRHVYISFCEKKQASFRVNTLKTDIEGLKQLLLERGIQYEQIPWYSGAFLLKNQPQKFLTDTDLYRDGYLYVQSLSSMIPPLVLNPQPGERIADIAAAPGSKTTQMAAMMGNTGTIVANDKSRVRRHKLTANLKIQGVTNVTVANLAGQVFWQTYPEYFDNVLVDVPCSMEGRFLCDDPKSYEDWSIKKIRDLVQVQRFLLRSAVSATKPGGTIVYSTCTLAPEENEGIIDWILKRERDALCVEEVSLPIDGVILGLGEWQSKKFDPHVVQTIRILPSKTMEGFYVAKLKKLRSTIPSFVRQTIAQH